MAQGSVKLANQRGRGTLIGLSNNRGPLLQIDLSGFVAHELSALVGGVSGLTVPRLAVAGWPRTWADTDSRLGTSRTLSSIGVASPSQPEPRGAERAAAEDGSANASGQREFSRPMPRPPKTLMWTSPKSRVPDRVAPACACVRAATHRQALSERLRLARGGAPTRARVLRRGSHRARTRRACEARGTQKWTPIIGQSDKCPPPPLVRQLHAALGHEPLSAYTASGVLRPRP